MSWLTVLVFLAIFAAPWLIADLVTIARKPRPAQGHARRGERLGCASRRVPRVRRGTRAHPPVVRVPPAPYELIALGQVARWDEATEKRVKEALR